MAYKRYQGNTGRVERVETEREPPPPPPPPTGPGGFPPPGPVFSPPPPPPPGPGAGAALEELLGRLDPGRLEREDWLVLGILWLLYRLSGETKYLLAMGAYLFL